MSLAQNSPPWVLDHINDRFIKSVWWIECDGCVCVCVCVSERERERWLEKRTWQIKTYLKCTLFYGHLTSHYLTWNLQIKSVSKPLCVLDPTPGPKKLSTTLWFSNSHFLWHLVFLDVPLSVALEVPQQQIQLWVNQCVISIPTEAHSWSGKIPQPHSPKFLNKKRVFLASIPNRYPFASLNDRWKSVSF